jgi:hypothetical protein
MKENKKLDIWNHGRLENWRFLEITGIESRSG